MISAKVWLVHSCVSRLLGGLFAVQSLALQLVLAQQDVVLVAAPVVSDFRCGRPVGCFTHCAVTGGCSAHCVGSLSL